MFRPWLNNYVPKKKMEKQRIAWVDVLKYFGIFLIYIGHFGEAAGRTYHFVWAFHVPLFFFIAGCMESLNRETSILLNIKRKFVALMIPFYFFSLVSLAVYTIQNNLSLNDLKPHIIALLMGNVRNAFIVFQLWFLSCLFVTHVFFELIKLLKIKFLMIGISLILFIISEKILPFRPIVTPKWYYNVDSSLYYTVYFCLGYVFFHKINNILSSNGKPEKLAIYSTGGIAFIYTTFYFFDKDYLRSISFVPFLSVIIPIFRALIIIWFFIIVSYVCRNINNISIIGKNSLYLCGNEFIVKIIVPSIVSMFGLQITLTTPVVAFIYTALLLYFVNTFMVPVEYKTISVINKILK